MGMDDLKKQEVGTHRSQTTRTGFILKKNSKQGEKSRLLWVWVFEHFIIFSHILKYN